MVCKRLDALGNQTRAQDKMGQGTGTGDGSLPRFWDEEPSPVPPFRIAVKQNGEALLMEGINGRADNRVEFTFRCTASELFHELLSAFNKLESIILTNENFRNQGIKEIVLNSIGHYKEAIENSLKSR